jgi:nucleotide-binding universal stress UspA family protein
MDPGRAEAAFAEFPDGKRIESDRTECSSVVLVMADMFRGEVALLRASALSRILGAELKVVRVEEDAPPRAVPEEGGSADDPFYALRWERTLALETWRWCNRRLVTPIRPIQVSARAGAFVDVVTETAREVKPILAIISAFEVRSGADATRIAVASGVPVLVARPASPRDVVMAASDLSMTRVPVLKAGAALGSRLGADVVFFHNVVPDDRDGSPAPPERDPDNEETAAHTRRRAAALKSVADATGDRIEVVVAKDRDTTGAILRVSARTDADLVVVGARDPGSGGWSAGGRHAAEVVEKAGASVVVVPMGG